MSQAITAAKSDGGAASVQASAAPKQAGLVLVTLIIVAEANYQMVYVDADNRPTPRPASPS